MIQIAELECLHPLIVSSLDENHHVSTYYDTTDMALFSNRVGLRKRLYHGQWLQTLKTTGSVVNGLHQRDEWEHKLDEPSWDLARLKETALAPLIEQESIWSQVTGLFTTDFIRHTLQLKLNDGTEVELAYDQGEVRAGDLKAPIHEIELELKSGDVNQLVGLAEQLMAVLPLESNNISKAQQGYELVKQQRV
jgi:inorganic triphosphatase YgiF